MNAVITNVITDALLSFFVFIFFIAALVQLIKRNKKYTVFIVLFFLSFLVVTLLGSWAHYAQLPPAKPYVNKIWLAISLSVIFLNYCVVYAIDIPDIVRILVMLLSLVFAYFFQISQHFIFIAVSIILIYTLATIYSKSLTRVGFAFVVLSNLIWIGLREGVSFILGHDVPTQYRYDNDIYHFLLIISLFILYKSIARGNWSYPTR